MKIFRTLIKFFLGTFFLSKIAGCDFAPGSYPYAEKFEINVNEPTLIDEVQNFKKNNPQYIVPEQTQLIDGRSDKKDHWYHIYFYYPEEDKIIYAWTRPAGEEKTTFAFVSINDGLNLGHWKDINKDFSRSENKEEKKKFEERILNKIKEQLHAKGLIRK